MGGSLSSYLQQFQHNLFNKIDANGDGSITKSELQQAVTSAGGTTASADALFADLDPNNAGSVSEQQFAQNLPTPTFSPEMGAQLIASQEQASGDSSSSDPASAFANQLFSQLTNGGSTLTQSELEQAVKSAGGTTASADALYAQLDPNNTGSVSEQQFADNLQNLFNGSSTTSSSNDGNSAMDAMTSLMQSFAPPPPMMGMDGMDGSFTAQSTTDANGSSGSDPASAFANQLFSQLTNGGNTLTKSELDQAVTSAGGTTASADALYAQLDPNNTGSVSEQQFAANLPGPDQLFGASASSNSNGTGNSAADAMTVLLQNFAPPAVGGSMTTAENGSFAAGWSNRASGTSENSAQAALQELVQSLDGSTQSTASTDNSAQQALADLLQADGSDGSTSSSSSLPASLFGNVSQQMLSLMIEMQGQNQLG